MVLSACQKITDQARKLSFGHAQKLINILMKYHFVYFYSDLHEDWKKSHAWLEPCFSYFHAPIDRIVLKSLTEKYSFKVPPDQFSWTKWQWTEKVLYAELQKSLQKLVTDRAEMSHNNRLYFEMKELWKSAEGKTQNKVLVNKVKRSQGKDGIKNFVEEIVNKINKQGCGVFELNETTGYFSIARVGVRRYKNVVCFVKDEYGASISKYANIEESFFDNPPYNKLKRRHTPPPWLHLIDWGLYPYHFEYDLIEDKDVLFQLCRKACDNFRVL